MQLDWQDLKINGCPALWRALKQIETLLTQYEQATAELQYLVSEELLLSLARPSELREVVEELGHGWRIERQPATPNASAATSVPPAARTETITTTADTWLPDDYWGQYFAAVGE